MACGTPVIGLNRGSVPEVIDDHQTGFICETVDEAVALQEAAGLDVVTDGEMRRLSFQSQLIEAVEGFADWDLDAFLWGTWRSDELEDVTIERPPIGRASCRERVLRLV